MKLCISQGQAAKAAAAAAVVSLSETDQQVMNFLRSIVNCSISIKVGLFVCCRLSVKTLFRRLDCYILNDSI